MEDKPEPAAAFTAPVADFDDYEADDAAADLKVTWTAAQFIDHAKSIDWYLALGVVAVLAAVAFYFLTKDIVTSVTPLVIALVIAYVGRKKPNQEQYQLDTHGLTIGQKHLSYDLFRSFAVVDEGAFASLVFLPLKRFGMITGVYIDPADEDRILDLVSRYLPFEPRQQDPIDRLTKRIRF